VTGDHYSNNCPKKKKNEGERLTERSFGCKPWVKRASKSKGDFGEEDEEENEVEKARNEDIVNKWLIDDAVEDLIELTWKNR
jgi:hypothetical protein